MGKHSQHNSKEHSFRRLVEAGQENYFFYSLGINGVFEYVSPSIKNVLGYSPEEFSVNYTQHLTGNPVNSIAKRNTEFSMKGLKQQPYVVEFYHTDGSIRLLEFSGLPVLTEEGNICAVDGIAHDITGWAANENSLLESAKMEAFSQLTGGITHDFNNILSAIIGYAHLLKLKTKESDPSRKLVEQILSATERATNLTQSIFELSRKPQFGPAKATINEVETGSKQLLKTKAPVTAQQHDTAPAKEPETILVAEDDNNLRYLVKTLLTMHGYNVIEAVNGIEALEIFNQNNNSFNFFVSDLRMPGKDGDAVFNEMKKARQDLKAIILSGIDDSELKAKKMLHKDITFILKPVLPDVLVAKIREVIGKAPI